MRKCLLALLVLCLTVVSCAHNKKSTATEVNLSGKTIKEIMDLYDVQEQDLFTVSSPPCVLSAYRFEVNTDYDILLSVHNTDYKLRFNLSSLCKWKFSDFIMEIPSAIHLIKNGTTELVDFDSKLASVPSN